MTPVQDDGTTVPLSPEEYEVGRRVTAPDGQDYDVLDAYVTGSGTHYLTLRVPGSHTVTTAPTGDVRDQWDAVDPEDARAEREQEAQKQQKSEATATKSSSKQ